MTMNISAKNFVNCRRGKKSFVNVNRASDIVDDEFTLCLKKVKPPTGHTFDINQYKLPVLEKPLSILQAATTDLDNEITSAMNGITQNLPISAPENTAMENSLYQNMSLKLMPIDSDLDLSEKYLETPKISKNKKHKANEDSPDKRSCKRAKQKVKSKKMKDEVKDPSSAKVVLQKLNHSQPKKKVPSMQVYMQNSCYE